MNEFPEQGIGAVRLRYADRDAPSGKVWKWHEGAGTSRALVAISHRFLASQLAPYEILVDAIAPGFIRTPMSIVDGVDETTSDFFWTWHVQNRKIPLGRVGEAPEVARVAVFLASEASS